ncbi:MAG TPA: hypothetical protein PLD95_03430 [bacterium]|jgi:hypothetical protein|nr:hypothetical protein [bacterium]HOG38498.1 hypothetical protein [bacterium]
MKDPNLDLGAIKSEHIVDCDANPFAPNVNWLVESHQKGGQFQFDLSKIELYLSKKQKEGLIIGNDLRKELKNKPVLNACVLKYLLDHQELIPDDWKDKYVCFWGTIYKYFNNMLIVPHLYWNEYEWVWSFNCLECNFSSSSPAVLVKQS